MEVSVIMVGWLNWGLKPGNSVPDLLKLGGVLVLQFGVARFSRQRTLEVIPTTRTVSFCTRFTTK
jgi:hypothetical protein